MFLYYLSLPPPLLQILIDISIMFQGLKSTFLTIILCGREWKGYCFHFYRQGNWNFRWQLISLGPTELEYVQRGLQSVLTMCSALFSHATLSLSSWLTPTSLIQVVIFSHAKSKYPAYSPPVQNDHTLGIVHYNIRAHAHLCIFMKLKNTLTLYHK